MDVGDRSGQSDETLRWVRLGYGRSKLQPEGQPSPKPVFVKFYYTVLPTHSCIIYFYACMLSQLQSHVIARVHLAHKAYNPCYLSLYVMSLLTTGPADGS